MTEEAEEPLRVVLCSTPQQHAETVGKALVDQRLAACVSILPMVTSIYRWQENVCCDSESILVIKTRASLVGAVTATIRGLHPYEVPEIIALPIVSGEGNPDYARWVLGETRSAPASAAEG